MKTVTRLIIAASACFLAGTAAASTAELTDEEVALSPQMRIYVPDLEKLKTWQAPAAKKLSQ